MPDYHGWKHSVSKHLLYNMPPQKNGKYGKQERENLKFVHTYYPGLGFSMRFPARHGLPL